MDNKNITNDNNTSLNDTQTKKKSIKKIVLSVILTLIFAILAVGIYIGFIHKPDNGANSPPVFDTQGFDETIDGLYDLPEGEDPLTTDTSANTEESTTEPVDPNTLPRSEQDIYNFLFVGKDRVALNTDVIMLINFNTSTKKIAVLQIPRDTYIQLGYYNGKINGLFAYYYLTNKNDSKVALRLLADTLEQNLCIKIHNTAYIDLDGVTAIVDSLGGVEVNVPSTISYFDIDQRKYVTIPAGLQTLNGEQAEQFIRHRGTYLQADIGRGDAQKVFVSGLIKKVKSDFNLTTISKLVENAFEYISTDVSLPDAVYFAKQLLGVDMSEIKFMSMLGCGAWSYPTGGGLSYYVMVRKNMREMIDTYFNIYDFPITDGIFDKNMVFTSKTIYPHFHKYYIRQDIVTEQPYNADNINDNSISIPHV